MRPGSLCLWRERVTARLFWFEVAFGCTLSSRRTRHAERFVYTSNAISGMVKIEAIIVTKFACIIGLGSTP